MSGVKGGGNTRTSQSRQPLAPWYTCSSIHLLTLVSRGSREACGMHAGCMWEACGSPLGGGGSLEMLHQQHLLCREPSLPAHPLHTASRWGEPRRERFHPPLTEVENFASLLHPSRMQGPAAYAARGSAGLLPVPSSLGCFSISYAWVYFFSLALEARRMFLPLPPVPLL